MVEDIVVKRMLMGAKGLFSAKGMSSFQNKCHLIYMRKSHHPLSLSWREKPYGKTAEINQCVGPDEACVGWDRDGATASGFWLSYCAVPVEACKSVADISFSAAAILPEPLRYLCQSHL